MRFEDLKLEDLLDLPSQGGVYRFAGQRVLLLDAVALGILRSTLVKEFGWTAARGILTRLGYSHGRRVAEAIRDTLPWENKQEWQRAGGRLHRLQGLVDFEPVHNEYRKGKAPFADALWHNSYEAEQHILHFGQSDDCVCWSLCGFASGYLSAVHDMEVYCIEEACVGRGDAACRMVGQTRDEWGDIIEPHLVYYEKDCLDESLHVLRKELQKTEEALNAKKQRLGEIADDDVDGIVARSRKMKQVLEVAQRVAAVDSSVLLLGETGVGKERLARFIHTHSTRAAGPFVAVNCGALPEGLLESELFGFVRGAFTGADHDRAGLFEAAQGGTLFLDEVGEVSPTLQLRLLRVLQERKVRRLGENRDRPVDIRLLAATHRSLEDAVTSGDFREDLYYRLRVIEIRIPPLRERPDDILPLARLQLKETAYRFHREVSDISPSVARLLLQHPWPGNVRELHNAMERAVVFADSTTLQPNDLPPEVASLSILPAAQAEQPIDLQASPEETPILPLAEVEREHILSALEKTNGNKTVAARQLNIGVATLFRKIKKYQAEGHIPPN